MAMDHVEGLCPVCNSVKKARVSGPWVRHRAAKPQGAWTGRDESGAGAGSPLANRVTSQPKLTNSSVSQETTRSVPPYARVCGIGR